MENNNYKLYNGELLQSDQVNFSSSNRSLRYGDGLFETIKVADSFPLFYRTHHSRFVRGLDVLQLTIPDTFNHNYFKEKLLDLIDKNNLSNGILRLQAFRSGKGTYKPETSSFDWIVEVSKEDDGPYYSPSADDYRIDLYTDFKKNFSPISFFKSSNAQVYVLAALSANQKGVNNLIIQNDNVFCIETIAENLFIYKNGVVTTPPVSDGPIEGVMRTMIKKLLKWNHINFQEKSITIDDILDAEECFLTNIAIGIQPVSLFREKEFSTKFSIGLREKLNERIATLISQKDKL